MNAKVLRGVVHGKTIELQENPGVSDGEHVEVVLRPVAISDNQPGAGLLRTEGSLADDSEWDAIMQEVQQGRKRERTTIGEDV